MTAIAILARQRHVLAFGKPLGLTDEQIDATVVGDSGDAAWSDRDALLIQLCDELYETDSVSDKLWARLAGKWPPDQLLELIVTAGWYRLISYVINTCAVERESWAARFPARRAGKLAWAARGRRLSRRGAFGDPADFHLVDAVGDHGVDVQLDRGAAAFVVALCLAALEFLERAVDETERHDFVRLPAPQHM
jgi:hypothetical protein